ncbi:hypothetical protein [Palleronia pelagia]|uniref:Uncharacterized protein n=1 Tax=Palleronia pelagia TaxID=387096 RepID=A0A1H8HV35_9RHOB|nr:hypothetical protein [Palleronia pelagia]SEN60012.1 hypothetical protein SAMN04488011_10514 [Palleronia pelagia]
MADMRKCLTDALAAGDIDQGRADAARAEYERQVAHYERFLPRHQAEAAAAADLKEATRRQRRSRRHMVLNQLGKMREIKARLETTPDVATALLDMFETVPGSTYEGQSVRFLQDAIQARIRADLQDGLRAYGQNVLGRSRDPVILRNVVRELHGQDSGSDIAKAYAASVRKVQGWQRQKMNALGGDIGELADYGLRHTHDARAIEDAGFDAWASRIFDKLDWSRIDDFSTGRPFAPEGKTPSKAAARAFLEDVYRGITTRGWDNREPAMTFGGAAMYRKRDEPRRLHFRDGDAWWDYNAEFGMSDPLASMLGQLDVQARDIALMQVFGPNPTAGLEYATQVATRRAEVSGNSRLKEGVDQRVKRARVLLAHASGAVNQAEHEGWARFFSGIRHLNVATKLGSATLSAVSDLATISTAATVMRGHPGNMLSRVVGQVASSASREDAQRMGFVAETLMSIASTSARLTNDVVANDTLSRLSGFTIRASGLGVWTDTLRVAVQMETAGHLASQAGLALGDVDGMLQNLLRRHGITEADWDALRAPDGRYVTDGGADFISPFWWLEHQTALPRAEAEDLALRLQAALADQVELFIPSKRMRATAAVRGDTRPGTFSGELLQSTGGFKNYAFSFTMGQIAIFKAIPTPLGKAKYLAVMGSSTLVMGALALQLKELAKGRDPRPMDEAKFWLAAEIQAGGLGIFSDFLFSEKNRFGGGIEQTLAGPVAGFAGDVIRPIVANTTAAIEGNETYFGRDAANFFRYNTPIFSSLWPGRVAFDRLAADQLQLMLDPGARDAWRRQERNRERTYGNRTWWDRGAAAPDRAPDITNALGDLQ